MTEPNFSQLANYAVLTLTVASFTKLYFVDKKLSEVLLTLSLKKMGLLDRMDAAEQRGERHDARLDSVEGALGMLATPKPG